MSLSVGIVGLPNVGKSTLFNAVLKRQSSFVPLSGTSEDRQAKDIAQVGNFPFTTINPNVGVVDVVDKRLDKLADLVEKNEGKRPPIVYATIQFVDIAGLVEGANKGEGLGNQFLANIREVDMILQVVRDFTDPEIIREHSKNPDVDSDVINNELILKDIESIDKKLKVIKSVKSKEREILDTYSTHLNKGTLAYDLRDQFEQKDYIEFIKPLFLLTDKEMIYVFNVDESDLRLRIRIDRHSDPELAEREESSPSAGLDPSPDERDQGDHNKYKGKPVIYINAKLESELSSLSSEDQKAYLKDLGIEESGLDKITRLCFEKLGLISFLTAGVKETRAWEVERGSTAVEAAGRIHTDFIKNFIKAEIISYNDYVQCGTKLAARGLGKLRLEGKDYIVQDGDVIEFKIGS